MKYPYLLHVFNATKNVSPFDVNMAYQAAFDAVIPYSDVALEDIHGLTQDTIFSRGKNGISRTAMFIGGKDFGLAIDMLSRAKAAMVPPFEISVFADPSGSVTTSATMLACIEAALKKKTGESLVGKVMYIIGGTGPVGVCIGILAASCGAEVYLVSRRGDRVAKEYAAEYNARFAVNMTSADNSTDDKLLEFLPKAEIIVNAAKAGVQVLDHEKLKHAEQLLVVADANAVPPLGIEGIGIDDAGVELADTPKKALGFGALAIGNIKYKVHLKMFELMKTTDQPLYLDHQYSFKIARELVANKS